MNGALVGVVGGSPQAIAALRAAGRPAASLTVDLGDLAAAVATLRSCAVVLPMLDGPEGGSLAALCELAAVPYVGSPPRTLAMDAWTTKLVAQAIGVATPYGVPVTRAESRHAAGVLAADLPLVVTPVAAGRRRRVVHTADELMAALDAAFAVSDRALVEELVAGRPVEVAVLGRDDGLRRIVASPQAGPRPGRVAAAVYDALGCAGAVRFGLVIAENEAVVTEVELMPGLAEHDPVPRLFAGAGVTYPELLDGLICDALSEPRMAVALR